MLKIAFPGMIVAFGPYNGAVSMGERERAVMKRWKRKNAAPSLFGALKWVLLWIGIALLCGAAITCFWDSARGMEFYAGYLIELSLSMDNLFVFLSIFTAFGIPEHARRRVLHWGILGAVVLRLAFILAGVAVVERFSWVLYFFGALLIVNGLRMLSGEETEGAAADGVLMRLIRRAVPMTDRFAGDRFFVRERRGKRMARRATPLLGVLLLIECSDIIFAIDSVPAVFSVSTHPLIVYSSNILAVLGLRQLYFVLEYMAGQFRYVRYGAALILLFTGGKMLAVLFGVHLSTALSIAVIAVVLLMSVLLSLLSARFFRQPGRQGG